MLLKDREKRFKASRDGFFSVFDDWGELMDFNEKKHTALIDELQDLMELNLKLSLKSDWDDVFKGIDNSVKRFACCAGQKKIQKPDSEAA